MIYHNCQSCHYSVKILLELSHDWWTDQSDWRLIKCWLIISWTDQSINHPYSHSDMTELQCYFDWVPIIFCLTDGGTDSHEWRSMNGLTKDFSMVFCNLYDITRKITHNLARFIKLSPYQYFTITAMTIFLKISNLNIFQGLADLISTKVDSELS